MPSHPVVGTLDIRVGRGLEAGGNPDDVEPEYALPFHFVQL